MYVERQHFHHEEQPREDRCDRRGQSDARPHPGPILGPGLLAKPDDVGAAASIAQLNTAPAFEPFHSNNAGHAATKVTTKNAAKGATKVSS